MTDIFWKTKAGVETLVDDMSEKHVKNALKMLIRNKQNEPCCCFQKYLVEKEKFEDRELDEIERFEKEFYEWDNYGSG